MISSNCLKRNASAEIPSLFRARRSDASTKSQNRLKPKVVHSDDLRPLTKVIPQVATGGSLTQAAQCLHLDLSGALARYSELTAYLCERQLLTIHDPVVQLKNRALALVELCQ